MRLEKRNSINYKPGTINCTGRTLAEVETWIRRGRSSKTISRCPKAESHSKSGARARASAGDGELDEYMRGPFFWQGPGDEYISWI